MKSISQYKNLILFIEWILFIDIYFTTHYILSYEDSMRISKEPKVRKQEILDTAIKVFVDKIGRASCRERV